jgi:20S proteasome alpha/beta subunit
MVSDKAVTYGNMQYDTEVKKVIRIGNTFWYSLIAGDPTFAMSVVSSAGSALAIDAHLSDSVVGMMSCMRRAYIQEREKSVSDLVLSPRLLTKELLVSRPASVLPLDPEVSAIVFQEMAAFRPESSLLVCGFDKKERAHIFSVTNPGKVSNHDLTGFFAIGVGARTALARLLTLETQKKDKLPEALYQAFDAKVNAEIDQGVGTRWDAEVLVAGKKAIAVEDTYIELIDNVWRVFPDSPYWKKQLKYPKNWKNRLKRYCDRIMGSTAASTPKSTSRRSKSEQ